jgi:glucokinase
MTSLLADIGGTNSRCAVTGPDGRPGPVTEFRNRDFDSPQALLSGFVASLPADQRPIDGALAIAAPVRGDEIRMTNIDWSFSVSAIRDAAGLRDLRALNDFEALARALPALQDDELVRVGRGEVVAGKPKGVIGPGTGLGVASMIPAGDGWIAVGGEGGHVTLPAVNERESRVIAAVRDEFGHCSAERIISGPGLEILHRALHGAAGTDAAELARRADDGDAQASETFEVFFCMLGTVAANLALTVGAFGGIYIGGGITPRHRERFLASGFRQRFEAKGRYGDYLASIPTFLIVSPQPTLVGLAAVAAEFRQPGRA